MCVFSTTMLSVKSEQLPVAVLSGILCDDSAVTRCTLAYGQTHL